MSVRVSPAIRAAFLCVVLAALGPILNGCGPMPTARTRYLITRGEIVPLEAIRLQGYLDDTDQPFPQPEGRSLGLSLSWDDSLAGPKDTKRYLQIGLQGVELSTRQRPPLNVALAVDCSGSMAEEDKISYVKRAINLLIATLRDDDVFSLVTYSYDATVDIPAHPAKDRFAVQEAVGGIFAAGSTNIGQALGCAASEVRKHLSPERANVVVLLSDGIPTAGIANPRTLTGMARRYAEEGILVSTIGVGLDYNEELMLGLARAGGGNYYFLDSPEEIQRVFSEEVNRLFAIVAQEVVLEVAFGSGVELREVIGYPHIAIGDKLQMVFPRLFAGGVKVLLMELHLKPQKEAYRASAAVSFGDRLFQREDSVAARAGMSVTTDKLAAGAGEDPNVKTNLLAIDTAKTLRQAAVAMGRGNRGDALALISEQEVALRSKAAEYEDKELLETADLLARYRATLADPTVDFAARREALVEAMTHDSYRRGVRSGREGLRVCVEQLSRLAVGISQEIRESGARSVAVLDFVPLAGEHSGLGRYVAARLTLELVSARACDVVERSQIRRVLEEQSFQLTGAVDAAYAAQVGNVLAAQLLVLGTVVDAGPVVEVNARLISVGTGAVIWAGSVELEKTEYVSRLLHDVGT